MIKEGDRVPAFTLPDQQGNEFNLQDLLGKQNMVIYFYPRDETKGCTAQACSFRDSYEDFMQYDCQVIGISQDRVDKHVQFAQHHQLPFILLSDEKNVVRKQFGVPKLLGLFPGRVTYLVDKRGIVRLVFNSQMQVDKHVKETLSMLRQMHNMEK